MAQGRRFFTHFLDSPEQALLTIVCWTDLVHQGGATFIAPDSIGPVARMLYRHPEGLLPSAGFPALIDECHDRREACYPAGTVILMHPYMLHTPCRNIVHNPRFITNPPIAWRKPMQFNPPQSPIELAVCHHLGMDRIDFFATGERKRVVPRRYAMQKQQQDVMKQRGGDG